MNPAFWQGKRVFLTGHTGFKGAWMAALLVRLGANVTGYALAPATTPSLFALLGLEQQLVHHVADIRDRAALTRAMQDAAPELVIHMAAQALVRDSYADPVTTFETNVSGTLYVLEALRQLPNCKAAVIVTTDKCYHNDDSGVLFTEEDKLGGKDPYSASKAAAELVTQAYLASFLGDGPCAIATARAGNVIGGGDWSNDRLIPDVVRAVEAGRAVEIRAPKSTRPWQHVLEPVCGYLTLAERLYTEGQRFAGAWNFGPLPEAIQPVEYVLGLLQRVISFTLTLSTATHPTEAKALGLNVEKAMRELAWNPILSLEEAVRWTGEWYQAYLAKADLARITAAQMEEYLARVASAVQLRRAV